MILQHDKIFNADLGIKKKNYEEKISKKKISIDDILKLSNIAQNYSVFELSDNYLAKNLKKVSNILNENNYSQEDCILIIRTILNKLKRLLKIRSEIDNNIYIDEILSNFKPPIFCKDKEIVIPLSNSPEPENVT